MRPFDTRSPRVVSAPLMTDLTDSAKRWALGCVNAAGKSSHKKEQEQNSGMCKIADLMMSQKPNNNERLLKAVLLGFKGS